jgi:hypothetical protein
MFAPYDSDVVGGTSVDVYITTTNADDPDNNGIQYPATPGIYDIEVDIDHNGDATDDYYSCDNINVMPTADLNTLRIVPGHHSENSLNRFVISFTVVTALNVNAYFAVHFPTRDKWGNTLFLDDLG